MVSILGRPIRPSPATKRTGWRSALDQQPCVASHLAETGWRLTRKRDLTKDSPVDTDCRRFLRRRGKPQIAQMATDSSTGGNIVEGSVILHKISMFIRRKC